MGWMMPRAAHSYCHTQHEQEHRPKHCFRPVFLFVLVLFALALRAIVIGIWAVIGAVIAGSVIGYEVVVHCNISCGSCW